MGDGTAGNKRAGYEYGLNVWELHLPIILGVINFVFSSKLVEQVEMLQRKHQTRFWVFRQFIEALLWPSLDLPLPMPGLATQAGRTTLCWRKKRVDAHGTMAAPGNESGITLTLLRWNPMAPNLPLCANVFIC